MRRFKRKKDDSSSQSTRYTRRSGWDTKNIHFQHQGYFINVLIVPFERHKRCASYKMQKKKKLVFAKVIQSLIPIVQLKNIFFHI